MNAYLAVKFKPLNSGTKLDAYVLIKIKRRISLLIAACLVMNITTLETGD
jgi:hypothetical protein